MQVARRAEVVEIVRDRTLRSLEPSATAALRRYFPEAPPLRLYRTRDGRIGFQVRIAVAAGERGRFEKAYAAVMKTVGQKRGRPAGERKVQAKLRLRAQVYSALKLAARKSHTTVSGLVESLAQRADIV